MGEAAHCSKSPLQLCQNFATGKDLEAFHMVLIFADGDTRGFPYQQLDFLSSLEKKDGKATAYLCENFTCSLPVTSSQELRRLLLS
ncbi:hypothetical protein JD844_011509 [Phrynosoma platyrhinos]|uniref:Thioredoxin domain-containing protein n=1 Tax=Phrynosoma platyrhinos TaxID=52577 RepID=A0ABQ7TIF3_PHRPL|nr:hypothetical protein JD844_011509 [Phrynosoma platyrhinos]